MSAHSAGPWLLLTLLPALLAPGVSGQETYDLRDYFPLDADAVWVYEEREGDKPLEKPLEIKIAGKEERDGKEYLVREQSNGEKDYYRYSDLGVENIGGVGESQIGLIKWSVKEPLVYPVACELGKTYEQRVEGSTGPKLPLLFFKVKLNMKFEFKLEAVEDCHVPAGTFRDCLKGRMVIDAGKVAGHESRTVRTVWFAEGLGEVRCRTEYGDGSTEERSLKSCEIAGRKF